MLVYANHLTVKGTGAEEAVFRAIGDWLKEQLGQRLRPDQLRRDGEYDGYCRETKSWLRVYATDQEEPRLYSWVLRTPDSRVIGRQWIVEAGVKIEDGLLELSCVVKTDARSTLVQEPVTASQPRVIRYVENDVRRAVKADFTDNVPGLGIRLVGEDIDSYRAFQYQIEDQDRDYPIVLVSPTADGEYLVDAGRLQQELIGLAEVVQVSLDFDGYEMRDVLGKPFSAWGGAVNVLHIATRTGFVHSRFFLSHEIQEWGDYSDRVARLLAWVTNNTNTRRLRNHVRPEGVMRLALRRRLAATLAARHQIDASEFQLQIADASSRLEEQDIYLEEIAKELHDSEDEVLDLEGRLVQQEEEIAKKDYQFQGLKDQLANSGGDKNSRVDTDQLVGLLWRTAAPSPSRCLDCIESVYGDRCVVLATAKESAAEMIRFQLSPRLLDLLRTLVTDYRTALLSGVGDSQARKVFGRGEYAAKESETVTRNKAMLRQRTFDYDGKSVEMLQHLKIGVADDVTKTIRVHFHWDASRKKIAIGYCGKHLPVSGY